MEQKAIQAINHVNGPWIRQDRDKKQKDNLTLEKEK